MLCKHNGYVRGVGVFRFSMRSFFFFPKLFLVANGQRKYIVDSIVRPVKFSHDFLKSLWNWFRVTDVPPSDIPYIVRKLCFRRIVWSEQIFFFFWLARKSRFRRDFGRFCTVLFGRVWGPMFFFKTGFERITSRSSRRPYPPFFSLIYNGEMS